MTEIKLETFYTTKYGDFQLKQGAHLLTSYDRDDIPLVSGNDAEAVIRMTATKLEVDALGLKEERTFSGTVGGKL